MISDVDRQIQRSADMLQRISARRIHGRARAAARRAKRAATYAVASVSAILVLTIVWAMASPIGIGGVLAAALAMFLAIIASVLFSAERPVQRVELGRADLLTLPRATERWLQAQRSALPPQAQPLLDRIGQRLEGLTPQLTTLNPQEPAAQEVRALLSEHLPQLLDGYRSIPLDLRRMERNGRVPDRQLLDGLTVIEREIGEMTEMLASGDLDRLAAHGRYLELRYDDPDRIARD